MSETVRAAADMAPGLPARYYDRRVGHVGGKCEGPPAYGGSLWGSSTSQVARVGGNGDEAVFVREVGGEPSTLVHTGIDAEHAADRLT